MLQFGQGQFFVVWEWDSQPNYKVVHVRFFKMQKIDQKQNFSVKVSLRNSPFPNQPWFLRVDSAVQVF